MKKSKKKRAVRAEAAKPTTLVAKKGVTPLEWVGWVVLVLAVIAALAVSWRKWPDPIVDFGRELYLPWQITQGGVLYRDMDANYGPLSHYFNALVFWLFGPGFMHLVAVNLVIYAGILVLLYYILRVGWGRASAFVGTMFFIAVFSFNQFVGIGNYNFAAPYSHETTHGFLLILALIATWTAWLQKPTTALAALAGLLCGLCVLLKLEVIFTATAVSLGAIVLAWISLHDKVKIAEFARQVCGFVIAGLLPAITATAVLYHTRRFSLYEAFLWGNSAWTGLFLYTDITQDPTQADLLGTSNISGNLLALTFSGICSLAALAAMAAVCKWIGNSRPKVLWTTGVAMAAAAFYFAPRISWLEMGKVFPAWLIAATLLLVLLKNPQQNSVGNQIRWLLLLAAWAFLARMPLNPRIYHCGYFQAALGGIVTVIVLWKMLPDFFKLQKSTRLVYLCVCSVLLASGIAQLQKVSSGIFAAKTQPLGTGTDQIIGFASSVEPTTALMEDARETLAKIPDLHRLFALPEGIMLNYLLRKPTATHVYTFNPYWLKWRESVLSDFERTPPDYVLLISRDMREFGVKRFGETPEHGSQLLSWIDWNCTQVRHVGGDPLDVTQRGTTLFRRNPTVAK